MKHRLPFWQKTAATIVILTCTGFAQLPDAPRHRFLDRTNVALFSSDAAAISMDGLSTQAFLRTGLFDEINPVTRMFGDSRQGTAGACALGFAAVVGGSYLAHRTGHHRLERILPMVVAGVEAGFAIHNRTLQISRLPAGVLPRIPVR